MGQQDALGLAGAAAGKNNRGDIVERGALLPAERKFEPTRGQEKGHQEREQFFGWFRLGGDVFEKKNAAGSLNLHARQEGL